MYASKEHKSVTNVDVTRSLLPSPFVDSAFDDNEWKTHDSAQGARKSVNWSSVRMDDGSLLVDAMNSKLLHAGKTYISVLAGSEFIRGHRAGTIYGEFKACVDLLRWLASVGGTNFGSMNMARVISYRNFCRRRDSKNSATGKKLSSRQRKKLSQTITNLAKLQAEMGTDAIPLTPSEVYDLPNVLHETNDGAATEPIADEVFWPLLQFCIEWLSSSAPKVLLVKEQYRKYRISRNGRVDNQRSRERYLHEAAPALQMTEPVQLNGELRSLLSLSHQEVERLLTITRAAAFIVIAALTGMRMSEICSLRQGCLRTLDLGGDLRVLELHGILYKTAKSSKGEPSSWVAGYDESDNPVRLAISVLEELPRPSWSTGLFVAMKEVQPKRTRVANSTIARSIRVLLEASNLSEVDITPHQFRKTFARFVARSALGSPFLLMRHFKHASVLMTERYLVRDPELMAEVFEESHRLTAESLDNIFGAERLGGLAGQKIVANNLPYRGDANAQARARLIKMTISDPSAYFRPSPHGFCLYDEATAKCRGKGSEVGLPTCVKCKNFAVDIAHLPNWIETRDILIRTIEEQASLGFISIDLNRQLSEANDVIESIVASGSEIWT